MSETALGLFRKACGLGAPLALTCQDVSSPEGTDTPRDYPGPFLLIGRDPSTDLPLNNAEISRRHAYLQAVAGRVFCIDLGSRTKIHWDGQVDGQSQGWLDPGRFIQVGPYRIHRTDRHPDEPPQPGVADPFAPLEDAGSEPTALPRLALELPFRVGGRSSTWEMVGSLALVGRSDECQLVLTDESISKYHACLVRTPLGLWLIDLAAREGVHVNGTRVRWAWLADGDLVRVGVFTLVLRYETVPEGICRQDVPLEAGASPTLPIAESPSVAPRPSDHDRRALAVRSQVGSQDMMRAEPPRHAFPVAAPVTAARAEWEPVIPTGPNPVAMWQQQIQLMETFHNDMIMMVQMFLAMHREHRASVRDELDRVQQLTRELNRLSAKLNQPAESPEASPASDAGRRRREVKPAPRTDPSRPEQGPLPPTPQRTKKRTQRKPPDPADAAGLRSRTAPGPEDSKQRGEAPPPPIGTAEMYANLTKRITELQRERQGYWQRILSAINK